MDLLRRRRLAGVALRRRDGSGLEQLRRRLGERARYERQIDRLHQRHMSDGGLWRVREAGVSLGSVVMQRSKVAALLAGAVSSGEYQLRPATVATVRTDGKERAVYRFGLFDLIIHGVVAEILGQAVEPTLSPNLYSYRRGVSWLDGVSAFARYARRHRTAHADPHDRGLYVLRRDIEAYTDTIPVHEASPIWEQLHGVLGLDRAVHADAPTPWAIVRDVVRPWIRGDDGAVRQLDAGVATGQPVASLAFNLYLRDLDHELAALPGAFYARYSDDLLFAHPDPGIVQGAARCIETAVSDLRLDLKASKSQDLYLTGAGRPSLDWPGARGTRAVPFLGMTVALDGSVSLGGTKLRRLLREARHRTRNAARASVDLDQARRGRTVVASVNGLLEPRDAALQGAPALLLASAVTDRGQLAWLDHELARMVASTLAGRPGDRAFRSVPYRTIREEWGLRSTHRSRDRSSRARPSRRRGRARV